MAEDFLHQPLGQERSKAGSPHRRRVALLGSGAVFAVLVAAGWWATRPAGDRPSGVVAAIGAVTPAPPAPLVVPVKPADPEDVTGGIAVVRPPGTPSPAVGQFIKVPQDLAVALEPAPDPRLVEQSRFGPLPRRGSGGDRPADVYARPVVIDDGLPTNAPRIALMVGGMGLNPTLTASAIRDLPPAVTLGFAPYGERLDQQAAAARAAGHETILQLPMEGYGDPAAASMSHLLATGLDGKEVSDRLHWLMGRFTGYAGVANFLGGRFMTDATALTPVLRDIASRGLYFLDDGSTPRTLLPDIAPATGLPTAQAEIGLDALRDPGAEAAMLDRLREGAKNRGCAVAVSSGVPASLSRIAAFASSLAGHGIALVPVSACLGPPGRASARVQP